MKPVAVSTIRRTFVVLAALVIGIAEGCATRPKPADTDVDMALCLELAGATTAKAAGGDTAATGADQVVAAEQVADESADGAVASTAVASTAVASTAVASTAAAADQASRALARSESPSGSIDSGSTPPGEAAAEPPSRNPLARFATRIWSWSPFGDDDTLDGGGQAGGSRDHVAAESPTTGSSPPADQMAQQHSSRRRSPPPPTETTFPPPRDSSPTHPPDDDSLSSRSRIDEVIQASYPADVEQSLVGEAPLSIEDPSFVYQEITPDEAVRLALMNSKVFRELGGSVLEAPQTVRTILEPATVESDPRFGVEAALSAFDAQLSTSALLQKNDRAVNNRFLSDEFNILKQDLFFFDWQVSKRAATGAEFTARHRLDYDQNNITGSQDFPRSWNSIIEGEIRQPLFRGAGVQFNRLAGPLSAPGVINGVVISRLNTDISLVEFEMGVRDLVSSVENAYWDLYYAYRDLQAKKRARDATLGTLQEIRAQGGLRAAQIRALATEQYYRFQADVEDALGGRLLDGTQSDNGSSGGTFRGSPGVLVAERRLRLLIGLPINDGKLLRPAIEPTQARIVFDWNEIAHESLRRRPELHKQRLMIRRRDLELTATRNFLLPQFDAVGLYRWRGFGADLLDAKREGRERFDNAFMDLTSGDFQEWHVGLELNFPIGFRRAHSAVRHAQLLVARETAVLREQERQVIHDLSNVVTDMNRSYRVARTAYNRYRAAVENREAIERRERLNAKADLAAVLDAQRRELDAETQYFRKLVEYAVSIKNVHYEKGSLLQFNNVLLAENMSLDKENELTDPGGAEPLDPPRPEPRGGGGGNVRPEGNGLPGRAASPTDGARRDFDRDQDGPSAIERVLLQGKSLFSSDQPEPPPSRQALPVVR